MFMATRQERFETTIKLSLQEEVVREEKKPPKKKVEDQEESKDTKKSKKQKDAEATTAISSEDALAAAAAAAAAVRVEIVPLLFPQKTTLLPEVVEDNGKTKKVPGNVINVSHLFQAIYQGKLKDVVYSLRFVNILSHDEEGRSPLMAAMFVRNDTTRRRIIEALVKNGASYDLKLKDWKKKRDLLGWCSLLGRAKDFDRLTELVDGDVDYYARDADGSTYLHLAVQSGNIGMVEHIVREMRIMRLPVDSSSDNLGLTPYILARKLGYGAIAEKLRSEGRASLQRHDDKDFLSPRQWSIIGHHHRAQQRRRPYNWEPPAVRLIEELELEDAPRSPSPPAPAQNLKVQRKVTSERQPQRKTSFTEMLHNYLDVWSDQAVPSYREHATEVRSAVKQKRKKTRAKPAPLKKSKK